MAHFSVSQFSSFKLPRLKFPTELEFEPVQLCNAKCFCCPYTWLQEDEEYRGKKMTREQIEHLLTDFGEMLERHDYTGHTTINPFRYSDPLVCKDLDLILDICRRYGMKVQVTTNAVSFHDKNTKLLEKYIDTLTPYIYISVIGSTREEVKELMSVDLDRTLARLKILADRRSPLLSKLAVSLRPVSKTVEERARLKSLRDQISEIGVGKVFIKDNWLNNRIDGDESRLTPDHYIKGCNLADNKLLRRMEVMVNGDVVLCDDDAEGRKVFGNVFRDSIESIWQGPLFREHSLIFEKKFNDAKKDLICRHCTRAEWNQRRYSAMDTLQEVGRSAILQQWFKGNVDVI